MTTLSSKLSVTKPDPEGFNPGMKTGVQSFSLVKKLNVFAMKRRFIK
jgi:hypothetical protein